MPFGRSTLPYTLIMVSEIEICNYFAKFMTSTENWNNGSDAWMIPLFLVLEILAKDISYPSNPNLQIIKSPLTVVWPYMCRTSFLTPYLNSIWQSRVSLERLWNWRQKTYVRRVRPLFAGSPSVFIKYFVTIISYLVGLRCLQTNTCKEY